MNKAIVGLLSATLAGCATVIGTNTEFVTWRGDQIYKGEGGAVETIDDIEFWKLGEPEKPFKIIGYIQQSAKDGVGYRLVFGSVNRSEIISKVKENFGSGVIELTSDKQLVGSDTSYNSASDSFSSRPRVRKNDGLAVFRYVGLEDNDTGAN